MHIITAYFYTGLYEGELGSKIIILFCSIYLFFSFLAFSFFALGLDNKRYIFETYYWIHMWGWLFLSKVYLVITLYLFYYFIINI